MRICRRLGHWLCQRRFPELRSTELGATPLRHASVYWFLLGVDGTLLDGQRWKLRVGYGQKEGRCQ